MSKLGTVYQSSLSLLTDLYQLTMAYGYFREDIAQRDSVFHLFFRKSPFQGGYTIAAGLETAIEWIDRFSFDESDLEYLGTLTGRDGKPLFDPSFAAYLRELTLTVDIDAIPEGTVVFPHQPLLRVRGPLLQCQLLETCLLNIINFQSLIATKSSRICRVAGDEPVLEFGLRRAQGIDGSLSASRAAFIGGCSASSNVLAGKIYGIPVRGTHAHSWVMSFDDELTAFEKYADALPNNCVFLVDTYDTLQGVRNAVKVGKALRERGHEMVGVRLDSGDLAKLSIGAREILDQGGFPKASIVASNDLDEHLMASLKSQGARISVWGVGTKLVTAYDQPALGGVYKLGAIQDEAGNWQTKLKLSEQPIKVSNPGILNVRRYLEDGLAKADMIFSELQLPSDTPTIIDMSDATHRTSSKRFTSSEDLLVPVIRNGKLVYSPPTLLEIQARAKKQLKLFESGVLRLDFPQTYTVGLEEQLHLRKMEMMIAAREGRNSQT